MKQIPSGIWPTMITPFTDQLQIDYIALEALIEWYISKQVNGLFAVCQSSEMFFLTLEERVKLAAFVVDKVNGRVPVIASGHISDQMEQQLQEILEISRTGIDAFVLVTNRFASRTESDEVWIRHADHLLNSFPDMTFGLYECPYPYKRLLSAELMTWCAESGRFAFLKDTSCRIDIIQQRIKRCRGTALQLFNANSATFLQSLKAGAAGFSGVMSNFHPELYRNVFEQWQGGPEKIEALQSFLSVASLIEHQNYPLNAKYYLQLEGLPIEVNTRIADKAELSPSQKAEIEQLRKFSHNFLF